MKNVFLLILFFYQTIAIGQSRSCYCSLNQTLNNYTYQYAYKVEIFSKHNVIHPYFATQQDSIRYYDLLPMMHYSLLDVFVDDSICISLWDTISSKQIPFTSATTLWLEGGLGDGMKFGKVIPTDKGVYTFTLKNNIASVKDILNGKAYIVIDFDLITFINTYTSWSTTTQRDKYIQRVLTKRLIPFSREMLMNFLNAYKKENLYPKSICLYPLQF